MRLLTCFSVLIALSAGLCGQTTLTFHTTADSDGLGWMSGDSVVFTLTFDDNRTEAVGEDTASENEIAYIYEYLDRPNYIIWSNVSITGAQGSWGTQTANNEDPASYFDAIDSETGTTLYLYAASDSQATGLFTPNSTSIGWIELVDPVEIPVRFTYTGSFMTPDVWVGSVSATFIASGGFALRVSAGSGFVTFSGSDVSINVSAVPEPATSAAILGGAVLLGGMWHRRRKSPAQS